MRKYYIIVLCGMFIAMQVILGRYLAVDATFVRISFVFIPIAIGGAIFGPLWNGIICAAADIAGFLLYPGQGPFFPGFTLSAFLSGAAYGFFMKSAPSAADVIRLFIHAKSRFTQRRTPQYGGAAPASSTKNNGEASASLPQYGGAATVGTPPKPSPLSTTGSLLIRVSLAAFCVNILINALLNTLWIAILLDKAYMFFFIERMIKSLILMPINIAVIGAIWKSLGKFIASSVCPKISAI